MLEAATAQAGLTQAATGQPTLILLDLGLPDLDGLEVTRRLREWTTMPIIVLSARGREKVVTHCQLVHEVWGEPAARDTPLLWVYMRQLRQKLEAEPARAICSPSRGWGTASRRTERATAVNIPRRVSWQSSYR